MGNRAAPWGVLFLMKRLVLASCLTASVAVAQNPVEQAIDRAVSAYAGVKTARASFEQQIVNPLTGSTTASRGSFEQLRPDRFAFRFDDPKGDMIVSDGKFVWLYLPSSTPGQVIRAPLTADLEGSIDLIGAFFSNPRTKYGMADAGDATVNGRATRAVALTPKTRDASFSSAKVWIDKENGLLRQFEAVEHTGVTRKVKIVAFEPNVEVGADAFRFKVPKGVRIVNGDALR